MSNYKSNHKKKVLAQKGQVVVIIALLMVCLIGMAALVVDVGSLYQKRAFLQTAADSAALAGAQELPENQDDIDGAIWVAKNYADIYYNVDPSNIVVVLSKTLVTGDTYDTITVTLSDPAPVYFAGVLGINTVDVGASATAMVGEPEQVYNVVPWPAVPWPVVPWAAIVPAQYISNWWDYLVPDVDKWITTYNGPGGTSSFCAWYEERTLPYNWNTVIYPDRIKYGYSFPLSVNGRIYVQAINMTYTVPPTATRVGGVGSTWANLDSFDSLVTREGGLIKLAKSSDTQLVIVPVIVGPGALRARATIIAFAPFIILRKNTGSTRIYGRFIDQALIVYEGEVKGVVLKGLRVIRLIR